MIEVFKTDVQDPLRARELLNNIHAQFPHYQSNFDLDDCDRILRVKNKSGAVEAGEVIKIIRKHGHDAECL